MQVIEIIDNDYISHQEIFRDNAKIADTIDIVVAFAKFSGMRLISDVLNKAIERGVKVRFVVGIDFYVSDPNLLKYLHRLMKKDILQLYVSSPDKGVFHSKLYAFYGAKANNFIIGSANFTGGGLADNWELSTYIRNANVEVADRLKQYVSDLITQKIAVPLTSEIISDYEQKYQRALAYRGLAEKKIENGPPSDRTAGVEFFEVRLETLRADGFEEIMVERNVRRNQSLLFLREMANGRYNSSSQFLSDFDQLISLYNSSALYRGRVAIGDQWREVIELYRRICSFDSANEELDISSIFEMIKTIKRFGVNLLTEPLHSVNNTRFAIMNGNSVYGLRKATGRNYEKYLNKMLINSEIYLDFCADMLDVMARLGLNNLSELDTLFNYFYFNG